MKHLTPTTLMLQHSMSDDSKPLPTDTLTLRMIREVLAKTRPGMTLSAALRDDASPLSRLLDLEADYYDYRRNRNSTATDTATARIQGRATRHIDSNHLEEQLAAAYQEFRLATSWANALSLARSIETRQDDAGLNSFTR